MKNYLSILCALFFFASCEKDFPLDAESSKPRLTINANLNPDEKIKIFITESFPFNADNKFRAVRDATVQLFENGNFLANLNFVLNDGAGQFGYYTASVYPIAGNEYSIKVAHPILGQAEASDIIPFAAEIVNPILIEYHDSTFYNYSEVSFQIRNQSSGNHYYRLNIYYTGIFEYTDTTGQTFTKPDAFGTKISELQGVSDTIREINWWYLFSDHDFKNGIGNIQFETTPQFIGNAINLNLIIELQSLSFNAYEYFTTLQFHRDGNDNHSKEPVIVYNNIDGGLGIFCSQNISSTLIVIK